MWPGLLRPTPSQNPRILQLPPWLASESDPDSDSTPAPAPGLDLSPGPDVAVAPHRAAALNAALAVVAPSESRGMSPPGSPGVFRSVSARLGSSGVLRYPADGDACLQNFVSNAQSGVAAPGGVGSTVGVMSYQQAPLPSGKYTLRSCVHLGSEYHTEQEYIAYSSSRPRAEVLRHVLVVF